MKARVAPSARDWILVGFGEGTLGYNDVSGNMEALRATDIDKDVSIDGRSAFYAKGRVRGEWLLTLAYNSDGGGGGTRDDENGQHSLGQQIDPNKYYTLYGDGAEQRYDAETQSKLYVRLERPDFYALFGDFDTGFDSAELTQYTRRLNGARGEYYGERLRLEGFAAQTDQGFIRDEVRGDGTSGEYRLSGGGIVVNSETLHIEVHDRFKSEVVLAQQTLTRYLDYTIDYDAARCCSSSRFRTRTRSSIRSTSSPNMKSAAPGGGRRNRRRWSRGVPHRRRRQRGRHQLRARWRAKRRR